MDILLSLLTQNTLLVTSIAGVSFVLLFLTVVATPRLVAKLPKEYFLYRREHRDAKQTGLSVVMIIRTAVGVVLILAGFLLMLTPGPGLVVLLAGLSITEFPGKHKLLVTIATHPSVFRSLNWMREKQEVLPFEHPDTKL